MWSGGCQTPVRVTAQMANPISCLKKMAVIDRMTTLSAKQFSLTLRLHHASGADAQKLLEELDTVRTEWQRVRVELEDHLREHQC
jgi:hypothetical protein